MMARKNIGRGILVAAAVLMLGISQSLLSKDKPLIYPIPVSVKIAGGEFLVNESTSILVPDRESQGDKFLRTLVSTEFADRYGRALTVVKNTKLSAKENYVLIGTIENPLVRKYCELNGFVRDMKELGDEGYILSVTDKGIVVAANKANGALYGVESLRQIIKAEKGRILVPQLLVKDRPKFPFRGIKLYLPGRENITFFKRFVRDFVAAPRIEHRRR